MTSLPQLPSQDAVEPDHTAPERKVFDLSDKIVLICGIAGALLTFGYQVFLDHTQLPWAQRWILAFPLQWTWLVPLAVAMLADMRSRRRWWVAAVLYAVAIPALSALSIMPRGDALGLASQASNGYALTGATMLTSVLGFLLLPLVRAFDNTQPLGNYPGVFRAAWRIAVQGTLAGTLALCVMALLYVGAEMFAMIGLGLFAQWFGELAFWLVIMPLVFAVALVGVQRRPQLTTVLQRSWLTLNAWMLPLASALAVAFVAALVAQLAFGLAAGTLSAGILIGFVAVWIKLVNSTWQDGLHTAPFGARLQRVLRWSLYGLPPLAGLALYNVGVRVDQYGWSVARVWAAMAAALAVLYAVGYVWAAIRPARFHATLARTNLFAAFSAIAILVAVNTPLLDPRRITAQSQTERLIDGRLPLEDFEFSYLRSRTGQYGQRALQQLADGAANARDPKIAELAKRAIAGEYISSSELRVRTMPALTVYPAGRTIPDDWRPVVEGGYFSDIDGCIDMAKKPNAANQPPHCSVIFADLSGTGTEDLILFVPGVERPYIAEVLRVFRRDEAGTWARHGTLTRTGQFEDVPAKGGGTHPSPNANAASSDSSLSADIARGQVRTQPRQDRELVIGTTRFQM